MCLRKTYEKYINDRLNQLVCGKSIIYDDLQSFKGELMIRQKRLEKIYTSKRPSNLSLVFYRVAVSYLPFIKFIKKTDNKHRSYINIGHSLATVSEAIATISQKELEIKIAEMQLRTGTTIINPTDDTSFGRSSKLTVH